MAFSWLIPSLVLAVILYSFPDERGSPASSDLRLTPRRTSLDWKTSRTAFTRSSEFASISMASPDHWIEASVFLKSKRCRTSLAAWFKALSTSCRSTLLTMSNELSAATVPPQVSWPAFPDRSSHRRSVCYCYRSPHGHLTGCSSGLAGCPSGQRERSVKPSASPTLVRTQHLPQQDQQSLTRCDAVDHGCLTPMSGRLCDGERFLTPSARSRVSRRNLPVTRGDAARAAVVESPAVSGCAR